jgi:hypothetical protein
VGSKRRVYIIATYTGNQFLLKHRSRHYRPNVLTKGLNAFLFNFRCVLAAFIAAAIGTQLHTLLRSLNDKVNGVMLGVCDAMTEAPVLHQLLY